MVNWDVGTGDSGHRGDRCYGLDRMGTSSRKAKATAPFCLSAALVVCAAGAQEPRNEVIEIFESPRFLHLVSPKFPANAAFRADEGWVIVNFMVDEQGKAFEPSVVDSMGNRAFEAAALDALAESSFKPATLSGKAIVGSETVRYRFVIEDRQNAARWNFVSRYRRLLRFFQRR